MKNTKIHNSSGIKICDSIVMSVKKKSLNLRKPEAIAIAAAGYIAVILSFLNMFSFCYDESTVFLAAAGFSAFYITLTIIEGKALWLLTGSVLVFSACAYKALDRLVLGFQYVYNVIYSDSLETDIEYYKNLKPQLEEESVTILFVFGVWMLALVIYFFTVCHPNPILPLMVTFPIIEIGLYNGIEIPVFWGVVVIAYWLALLGMSTIDVGEYSGGNGGFVRKDNTFFPKRQMKLKVTEKCGIFIIAVIMLISMITYLIMQITGYERSEKINQKRRDISYAFSQFSFDDLASSLSKITSAFGFTIESKSHKLGTNSSIKYKNTTDLIATFHGQCSNAVYIKDYVGSVYSNNEWRDLNKSAYKDEIFSDFKEYEMYPQDFANTFTRYLAPLTETVSVNIESKLKNDKSFSPYGTERSDDLEYYRDTLVSSGKGKKQIYKFVEIGRDLLNELPANPVYRHDNSDIAAADLMQQSYRSFVYRNYLQLPDNKNMDEIRAAYSDILSLKGSANSAADKLRLLDMIRSKMTDTSDYTLSPGKTPSNRDFVNYFLTENHKGYCVHFATSGVILARMAGIPARYATGYIIVADDFNSDSHVVNDMFKIDVKDNRSHAWAEIYLDGFGWIPYEFTAGYSNSSIDHNKPNTTTTGITNVTTTTADVTTAPVSTTKRNSQHTTNNSTDAVTTSAAAATSSPGDGGSSSGIKIPLFVKRILAVIISIAAVIGFIMLRRHITVTVRQKRLNLGSGSHRIGYIYDYTERLLAELGIERNNMRYVEFAEYADKQLGGVHVKQGSLIKLTDIALHSGFGKTPPTADELKECLGTTDALAQSIYEKSGFFGRISLKYFKCII